MPLPPTPQLALLLLALGVVGLGWWDLRRLGTSPGCEMTYSRPSYHEIPLPDTTVEGGLWGPYRLLSMHPPHEQPLPAPYHRPVLFVPGHMGSYRQARSLQEHAKQWHQEQQDQASASLLHYYTLDFRGEACALHGSILERQAAFVHRALAAIAARHQTDPATGGAVSVSVLIVGHSYGGMVAKGGVARVLAAASEEGKSEQQLRVPVLVTLGSPHQRPPWNLDGSLAAFYAQLEASHLGPASHHRRRRSHKTSTAPHTAPLLISLSGGHRDALVWPALSSLDNKAAPAPTHALGVVTGRVPGVGMALDHLAILWCHQLLRRVTKALHLAGAHHDDDEESGPKKDSLSALASALLGPKASPLASALHGEEEDSRALLHALGSNPLRLLSARLVREYAEWPLVLWTVLALLMLAAAWLTDGGDDNEGEGEGKGSGWGGVDGVLLLVAVGVLVADALKLRDEPGASLDPSALLVSLLLARGGQALISRLLPPPSPPTTTHHRPGLPSLILLLFISLVATGAALDAFLFLQLQRGRLPSSRYPTAGALGWALLTTPLTAGQVKAYIYLSGCTLLLLLLLLNKHQLHILILHAPVVAPLLLLGSVILQADAFLLPFYLHPTPQQTPPSTTPPSPPFLLLAPLVLHLLFAWLFPPPPPQPTLPSPQPAQPSKSKKKEGDRGNGSRSIVALFGGKPAHGRCPRCLHPDGGREAVYVETARDRTVISPNVALGPGFRVVECDCSTLRPALRPTEFCGFCQCQCRTCGGSPLAKQYFASRPAMGDNGGGLLRRRGGRKAGGGGASGDGLLPSLTPTEWAHRALGLVYAGAGAWALWAGLGKGPYACLPPIALADAAAVGVLYVPAWVGGVWLGRGKEKRE